MDILGLIFFGACGTAILIDFIIVLFAVYTGIENYLP
jgi:hypothetical protein